MYFKSLNLKPYIVKTLNFMNITKLTDIQEQTVKFFSNQKSLIITAETGSGKTLCYLLPILNNINTSDNVTQAFILLPTKELANQVYTQLLNFKKFNNELKIKLLQNSNNNKINNKIAPHIVIGTPVQIKDYLNTNKSICKINYFILDEADMLVDSGFYHTINEIFVRINKPNLIKIAASATLHNSLANQLKKILTNTFFISASNSIWKNNKITHNIVYQSNTNNDKMDTLNKLLKVINPYFCIIFTNTKNEAINIFNNMKQSYNVGLIHKDLLPRQRQTIFKRIKANQFQYLVATDLIARGVDLPDADLVISYALPTDTIWYMHRSGRVGRYKNKGVSYLIYGKEDDYLINNLIKKGINWKFLLIKNNQLIDKPFNLKLKRSLRLDYSTNSEIKKIININSKRIKPGYKKKIQKKIKQIKQKKRHEFIEKAIKQRLLINNINRTKKMKKQKNK